MLGAVCVELLVGGWLVDGEPDGLPKPPVQPESANKPSVAMPPASATSVRRSVCVSFIDSSRAGVNAPCVSCSLPRDAQIEGKSAQDRSQACTSGFAASQQVFAAERVREKHKLFAVKQHRYTQSKNEATTLMTDRVPDPSKGWLLQWRSGDKNAIDQLLPLVYDELRRVARRHLRGERQEHTLQTTALIHEVYLKLVRQDQGAAFDRHHFVALTSNLMREILVDYARRRIAQKRDGGCRITLTDDVALVDTREVDVLAVDRALGKLARLDEQQARVVELRYFGGLSIRETSDALGVSEATVKRDWETARAWLQREMPESDAP